MIPLHAIRNAISGLVTVGQQFLADTSEADHPTPPHNGPVGETGASEEAAASTPKKRGRPAKAPEAASAPSVADQLAPSTDQPKASALPVTRDMIRSAFGAYMAIPGIGQEKGKALLAGFGYQKLSEVPEEKLAELHQLVVSSTVAASNPDPFAA